MENSFRPHLEEKSIPIAHSHQRSSSLTQLTSTRDIRARALTGPLACSATRKGRAQSRGHGADFETADEPVQGQIGLYEFFSTELKGHAAGIEKVAFNPTKDAELCSLSSDGVVRFWDVRTKACFNEVTGLGDAMTLVWAPDGQTLLVGNRSDNIFVLSPTQSTPLASHQQTVQTNQIAFCWSGKKIFVSTSEGQIRILSYPEFEPVLSLGDGDDATEFTLKGHTASCLTAELQPMGRYLATGGANSIIALWDTTDWLCQRTITRMTGPVRSISFTFDGSYVVGGSDEAARFNAVVLAG
ncbi:aac-rich mrna clone aac3 [Trichoderma arundinaceum]|uniref:Aac-rich mrna clone aac3 n=1 Tax=Trichoderma arundinaceum TaxID=490622 RepID=A0A395N8I1_TRIAR|nr:aac-rich mrna clone aac3 [Trichoderma arundinaceum]